MVKEFNELKNISKMKVDYFLIDDYISSNSIDDLDDSFEINKIKDKIIISIDHDTPAGSEEAAMIQKKLINFAENNNIKLYNSRGIGTILMMEEIIKAGEVVLGCEDNITAIGAVGAIGFKVTPEELTESLHNGYIELKNKEFINLELKGTLNKGVHSKDAVAHLIRKYKKSEVFKDKIIKIVGEGINNLTDSDLITICSLIKSTEAVTAYVSKDVHEQADISLNLKEVNQNIIFPNSIENILELKNVKKTKIDEVFFGGITGGKIEDLRIAAEYFKNKKVAYKVRVIIAPVSSKTYIKALEEGLIDIFLDSGCFIMNQGYSVDYGKSQGIIDKEEVLISTGINNKINAGSVNSKIFLSSPYVAAEAALKGYFGGKNE